MNASIRKIALVMGMVFVALFANLNYIQLGRSDDLANHPRNTRSFLEEIGRRRGEILAADGSILARSVPLDDDRFRFSRRYPQGELMAGITGFYAPSTICGSTGLENSYDDVLIGDEPPVLEDFFDELLGREREGNIVRLSIEPKAQRVAQRALGTQRGSIAAIDPRTGAVLALYSNPTYDPNRITRRHPEECGEVKSKLDQNPRNPLRFRAVQERYPSGSIMKVVTAAAALQAGFTPSSSVPVRSALDLPDSDRVLTNFAGGSCGGTMANALINSCNTAFGEWALRTGAKKFAAMTKRFGFDQPLDFDIPATESCIVSIPGGGCDDTASLARPFLAISAIGQFSVGVTALQMARVAATVSNGGRTPTPYLVQRIEDEEGAILRETEPQLAKRIYSKRVAEQLKQMMIGVVRFGSDTPGFSERSSGLIGGKSGTAQTPGDKPPHVWFIAFAPDVAVAVVVEHGGNVGFGATGTPVAGPIAKSVLESLRNRDKKK